MLSTESSFSNIKSNNKVKKKENRMIIRTKEWKRKSNNSQKTMENLQT